MTYENLIAKTSNYGNGTGFLIGPNDLLTNAHVALDIYGNAEPADFRFENGRISKVVDAQHFGVPDTWDAGGTSAGNTQYDLALVTLDESVGWSNGYFAMAKGPSWRPDTLEIAGYPAEFPDYDGLKQVHDVLDVSYGPFLPPKNYVKFESDKVTGGSSGSPLWTYHDDEPDVPVVLGVHAGHVGGGLFNSQSKRAALFTDETYDQIREWIDANGDGPDLKALDFSLTNDVWSANEEIGFSFGLENVGDAPVYDSAEFSVGLYVSDDPDINTGDALWESRTFSAELPDGTSDPNFWQGSFFFDSLGLSPGTYWVTAIANDDFSFIEGNYLNNTSPAVQIEVTSEKYIPFVDENNPSVDDLENSNTLDFTELSIEDQVTGIYIGYYGRAPDPAGRSFWNSYYEDMLSEGNTKSETIDDIAEYFRFADETLAEYPFFDPSLENIDTEKEGFEAGTSDPYVGFLIKSNTDNNDSIQVSGLTAEFGQGGNDILTIEGTSSMQPGLALGGDGADTYVLRGDETGVVYDGFASGGDILKFPLSFDDTFFATLEGQHLLLTSSPGTTAVIVANWQERDHKIETFDLAGEVISFDQIADHIQSNGDRFVGNLTIEEALNESFQKVPFTPSDLRSTLEHYSNAAISKGTPPATTNGTPLGSEAFVENIYENLFNRQSDQAGLEFWDGEINRRSDANEEIGNIITTIIAGAGDNDAQTLLNKIEVGNAYADSVVDSSFDRDDAVDIVGGVGSNPLSVDDALLSIA